ncbi:MAG: 9-O-acetylesterase [Planctomycetaceae bacterium]|jgi:sialate O-acetylesterase|nr:9-O-acetylesterase [Planctomycetaceae bacterium]
MKRNSLICSAAVAVLSVTMFCLSSQADVRLPEVFASNMVLQRDLPVPVWGWAEPGEKITVVFEGQTVSATADAEGKWQVKLNPLKAGGPFNFTVKGKNEIKLENVLVGEVWICSGQSNMEWTLARSKDAQKAIAAAKNPNLRLFQVQKAWNTEPQESLKAQWVESTPETVPSFSAVGYYFGVKLAADLKVPVGLINSSWGGTRIEPWTPLVGFESVKTLKNIADDVAAKDTTSEAHRNLVTKTLAEYKKWIADTEVAYAGTASHTKATAPRRPGLRRQAAAVEVTADNKTKRITAPPAFPNQLNPYTRNQDPTVLYNAMISPLVPLAVRGAIWYQGEANMAEGPLYAQKMEALIKGWRTVFNNPDLGFYYVQIAPFIYGNPDPTKLPELQEAQSSVEKRLPKTGQAIVNDLVDNVKDIHPVNKEPVGNRLALLALNRTYGQNVAAASPEFAKLDINGNTAVVHFKNAKSLKTRDGKSPDWFEIAGADGGYHKADAAIEGTTIKLTSAAVEKPLAVRFAWNQTAMPNVQNEAGLPLGPFRAGTIPERGLLDSFVPDAEKFKLVYSFDPTRPVLTDNNQRFVYKTDKSREFKGKKIKRVGYFLYLIPKEGKSQYVFVTLPPLDDDVTKLGVPVKASGARFQKQVTDVTVMSNVPGVETGTFADGFNVEFWDCNYDKENAANVPGADTGKYDFGDHFTANASSGYGSLQIHNFAKKQTVLAFNNFASGTNCDVGIGSNPAGEPDWTFSKSAGKYNGGQFLILVATE